MFAFTFLRGLTDIKFGLFAFFDFNLLGFALRTHDFLFFDSRGVAQEIHNLESPARSV